MLLIIMVSRIEAYGRSRRESRLFVSLNTIITIIEYHRMKQLLIIGKYRISKEADRQQAIVP